MSGIEISIIVISSLSLVASLVTPLIGATVLFMNRITKSDCCLGHIELKDPTNEQIQETNKKQENKQVFHLYRQSRLRLCIRTAKVVF